MMGRLNHSPQFASRQNAPGTRSLRGENSRAQLIAVAAAETPEAMRRALGRIAAAQPDMIEWRVDALAGVTAHDDLTALSTAFAILCEGWDGRILATYRTEVEGGGGVASQHSSVVRALLAESSRVAGAGRSGIDAIDIEASSTDAAALCQEVIGHGLIPVISTHDFTARHVSADDVEAALTRLATIAGTSGDSTPLDDARVIPVVKIAWTPTTVDDTMTMIAAARAFAERHRGRLDVIAIAMGEHGVLNRIVPSLSGSMATFVSVDGAASAPGQVDCQALRAFDEATGCLSFR